MGRNRGMMGRSAAVMGGRVVPPSRQAVFICWPFSLAIIADEHTTTHLETPPIPSATTTAAATIGNGTQTRVEKTHQRCCCDGSGNARLRWLRTWAGISRTRGGGEKDTRENGGGVVAHLHERVRGVVLPTYRMGNFRADDAG